VGVLAFFPIFAPKNSGCPGFPIFAPKNSGYPGFRCPGFPPGFPSPKNSGCPGFPLHLSWLSIFAPKNSGCPGFPFCPCPGFLFLLPRIVGVLAFLPQLRCPGFPLAFSKKSGCHGFLFKGNSKKTHAAITSLFSVS